MNNYKICSCCIMDTSDPEIQFDEQGVCNHCYRYKDLLPKRVHQGKSGEEKLKSLVKQIKESSRNSDYDCIIGVSGGVDSTYVAYLTKKLGLRPLAIHFDNGWNSELAVSNIEKTLEKLDIDLYTFVIDWEEFKDLQLSFLKASTPDGEIPTDHAINALLFLEASKRGIKFIINGMNFATESMSVSSWAYGHSDWKYISSIHKKFGKVKLNHYPHFTLFKLFWWTFVSRIQVISILNYIDYNKESVMNLIKEKLDWHYYGGKHYESVYTRFYQGYVLPLKYNIDKRRGHLSDMILSKQLSRSEALHEIELPPYDRALFEQDFDFVLKKFKLSRDEFQNLMKLPNKKFSDYPNNYVYIRRIKQILNFLRHKGVYSK